MYPGYDEDNAPQSNASHIGTSKKRYFTEEVKDQLLSKIESDIADTKQLALDLSGFSGDNFTFTEEDIIQLNEAGISLDLNQNGADEYYIHFAVLTDFYIDEAKRRKNKINEVWLKCIEADTAFSSKFEFLRERALIFYKQINELIEMIGPESFSTSPADFTNQCQKIEHNITNAEFEAEVNYHYKRLVDENGNYDWEYLKSLMACDPPENVPESAIAAMAKMMIHIGQNGTEEEIEHNMEQFFNACYITPSYNADGNHEYPDGTEIPLHDNRNNLLCTVLSYVFYRVNAYMQAAAMQAALLELEANGGYKAALSEEDRKKLEMFMLQASIMMAIAINATAFYFNGDGVQGSPDARPIHIDINRNQNEHNEKAYSYEYNLRISNVYPYWPEDFPDDDRVKTIVGTGVVSGNTVEEYIKNIVLQQLNEHETPDYSGVPKMTIDLILSLLADKVTGGFSSIIKILSSLSTSVDWFEIIPNPDIENPNSPQVNNAIFSDKNAASVYANNLSIIGANVLFSYDQQTGIYSFIVVGYDAIQAQEILNKYLRRRGNSIPIPPKYSLSEFVDIFTNPERLEEAALIKATL